MGRTILYILIGVSVVGALAVLLLITPVADAMDSTTVVPEVQDIATEALDSAEVMAESPVEVPEAIDVDETASVDPEDEPAEPMIEDSAVVGSYSIDGTIVAGEYANEMTIAGVDVYWSNDNHRLRVGLVSPGTGFVSIGFDPDRQMEGANFIIASVHEGELTIRDDYGTEPLAHMEDTMRGGQDNILTAAGNEWPDQTVVEFVIPLDSGDPMDKPLIAGHEYTVLVAYHSMGDSFSNRHTRRGSGQMQLDLPE
jgi:DOMON domain